MDITQVTMTSISQMLGMQTACALLSLPDFFPGASCFYACHIAGLHTDRVFLGENSDQLLTIWLPLHNVGPEEGGMMVCSGSHR